MTWTVISKQYANVFFRVFGDRTEAFGKIQDENTSMISKMMSRGHDDPAVKGGTILNDICGPKSGWSDWIWTGERGGGHIFMRFYYSGGEVRPTNMAIKAWKRTN